MRVWGVMLLSVLLLGALAPPAAQAAATPKGLRAFQDCGQLVRFAREHVRDDVPLLLEGGDVVVVSPPMPAAAEGRAAPAAGGNAGDASASPSARAEADGSTTNVQEEGVDEPDAIKRVGGRLFAVANERLQAVDITGDAPKVVGTLPLAGFAHQLLVRGTTALVLAEGQAGTVLTEIDVANPAAMAVRRSLTVPGRLVAARLTGGTARVVVTSAPSPGPAESKTLRSFVPRSTLRSKVSGRTVRRGLVACDDVRRPARPGGADLLTVLSVDLDEGLFSVDRDAIMATGQAVYASARSLYVASTTEAGETTLVHRFDASVTGRTRYRSSGVVPGTVLNQFSLSEHEGDLRVATTKGADESFVSVLRETGPALRTVGRVGGLGRGERIYAVRFLGDLGYVVTFRQVDPLYTIDLSTPTAPKVLGELKILGYSAYLHPVGEGLLLGVGVDATAEGRRVGAQVSLFDVSKPRSPKRLFARPLGEGSSTEVEFDHHAFLWWAPAKLAVLPVAAADDEGGYAAAARALRVDRAAGIADAGRIEHRVGDRRGDVARSVVVGDRLYTLSYLGVAAHRLDDLGAAGFAEFALPPEPPPSPVADSGAEPRG